MLHWFRRRSNDPKKLLAEALRDFELPTFRAIVLDAMAMLRQPDAALSDVGALVGRDPGLTSKLLQIANSPAYGLRHEVRSVEHAASLLGRAQLESLLVGVGVGEQLPQRPVEGYEPRRFWRAAARRATAARRLATKLHPATKGESFTAALLQDMAVPLLAKARGAPYVKILDAWRGGEGRLADLEQSELGFHHAYVAGAMAQAWSFPEALVTAIGAHHDAADLVAGGEGDGPPAAVLLVAHLAEDPDGVDARDVPGTEAVVELAHDHYGMRRDETAAQLDAAFAEADEVAQSFL